MKTEKKSFARKYVEKRLFDLSKKVLEKYKPKIIAITGSVGKTSTREAIFTVLNMHVPVRQSLENYNNEIGVPLTILGQKTAGKSLAGWLKIFRNGKKLLSHHNEEYPKVLVLEFGIDAPGDMDYLVKLATPDISVLTSIGISHLEKFGTHEKLIYEKTKLIAAAKKDGHVLINADSDTARQQSSRASAPVTTYGFRSDSDLAASDLVSTMRHNPDSPEERELAESGLPLGSSFKVQYQGSNVPFTLHRVLGRHQISPVLPAIVCGKIFGMNMVEIGEALKMYVPPKGRMNLIAGIKKSLIIDDTYNSAPDSALEALRVLKDLKIRGRKVAVLGDMLELGAETENAHRKVGEAAAASCDVLIGFGAASVFACDAARLAGMDEKNVHHVMDGAHDEIERILQNWISAGDVLLVKGSQSLRMEIVVKKLMAHPDHAEKLLVRQSETWQMKPFEMPN